MRPDDDQSGGQYQPPEDEEVVTPPGRNSIWDHMKSRGLPLTAEQYLRLDYGDDPASWDCGAERLIDVPIEIRRDVDDLMYLAKSRATTRPH